MHNLPKHTPLSSFHISIIASGVAVADGSVGGMLKNKTAGCIEDIHHGAGLMVQSNPWIQNVKVPVKDAPGA